MRRFPAPSLSRLLLALLLATVALSSWGCATNREVEKTDRSTLPWGRPAEWEGTVPGMSR